MLKLNLKIKKTNTHFLKLSNGEVAVEDHHSPMSAPKFSTSREVLPHHELHKGILESSASGKRNTSPNVLPKALLTVSVHTDDRIFEFEIKGVADPGVSVSEVRQLLVGSPVVCVDRRTRQNPTLNERQEDDCCPLTPRTWYDETPIRLPFNSSQNPILRSGYSSLMLHPPKLILLTNINKYWSYIAPFLGCI